MIQLISRYFNGFLFHRKKINLFIKFITLFIKINPAIMSSVHPVVPFHKDRIIAIFPQWGIFSEKPCHSIESSIELNYVNHWNSYTYFSPVSFENEIFSY